MSAPTGPRASSNSRGQSSSRARPRSRPFIRGGGVGRNAPQQSSDISMKDAPADPQTSSSRARGERGVRRHTSPRGARGESRGAKREGWTGRQTSPGAAGEDGSQHRLKPVPHQNNFRNQSWVNPTAVNAAFQSHAGKPADSRRASWRNPPFDDSYRAKIEDLYQTLKQGRERERKKAIKDGLLADPDKPTTLENAITPVGTCEDMCPEFERVERIVQFMVDGAEKISPSDAKQKVAFEDLMVKRFRRSAAGYDEQLPSDLRPPLVLQKTLNYLINDVVGGPEPLSTVHKFVWDRTRSIRNDFSIQQLTKVEDLKIAIDCFERIVRFHILSLHQLSGNGEDGDFDPHQEREQLNNALLSLRYYYEQCQDTFIPPNEAEFRAYAIIFEIQDQRPDVEDRLQNLPKRILKDPRVRTALKLYAAAANTADEQGPLRPRTRFITAQANTGGFWALLQSNSVSYLMACVAEIYFNLVRRTCLEAIWKAYKGKRAGPSKTEEWTLNDLTTALGFDEEEQTATFCEEYGFTIAQSENREHYMDLGSVGGGNLIDHKQRRKQIFSRTLVEPKRLGRTLPAVIIGMSASEAQTQGFVEDLTDAETSSIVNDESLFVDGDFGNEKMDSGSDSETLRKNRVNGSGAKLDATASPFNPFLKPGPGTAPISSPLPISAFDKPSYTPQLQAPKATFGTSQDLNSSTVTQTPFAAFSSKDPPKCVSLASTKTTQAEQVQKAPNAIFGQGQQKIDFDSAPTKNGTAPFPFANPTGTTVAHFGQSSTATSSTFPASLRAASSQPPNPSAVPAPGPSKSIFDKSASSSTPPAFSFGTSSLFQRVTKDQIAPVNNVDLASQQQDISSKAPLFSSPAASNTPTTSLFAPLKTTIEPTLPSPTNDIFSPFNAPTSTTFKLDKAESSIPQPASFPPKSSTAGLFQPNVGSNSSQQQSTPSYLKPSTGDRFQPKLPSSPLPGSEYSTTLSTTSALSGTTAVETTSLSSHRKSVAFLPVQPDLRSATIDKLADAMMLGDNGLLQQFIEFTVAPIIQSSVKHLEDEDSWEEARECRVILLSKKYSKKWRANAWSMSLMRKARERRRNFAKSVQEFARSTPQRESDSTGPIRSSAVGPRIPLAERDTSTLTMPPPSAPFKKRQSLPVDIDDDSAQSEAGKGAKRKRDVESTGENHRTPKTTKIGHRRSQTVGNSVMSAPPHGLSHSPYRSRIAVSSVPEGSMLNDILMEQARRLAPIAKSDTTRTDYFRLKALGIDPDTPVVPRTRERSRAEPMTDGDTRSTQSAAQQSHSIEQIEFQPALQSHAPPSTSSPAVKMDEDEALFAQIRSVREALAESEHWMHSERQSIERSTTSQQTSMSPPEPETPAQRRLREIKERGHQPSRTEVRLRAMGDKALLPKGFWDGEGMGLSLTKGKSKENESRSDPPAASLNHFGQSRPNGIRQQHANGLMGFAALGQMNNVIPGQFRQEAEGANKGASANDAIEL